VALSTTTRSHRPTAALPLTPRPPLTPQELRGAPELALLAALQQLLELTTVMLAATHPEVGDDHLGRPLDLQAILADQLIQLGAYLADTASRYRDVTIAALHASDALPF
jgi:hypothetical protein